MSDIFGDIKPQTPGANNNGGSNGQTELPPLPQTLDQKPQAIDIENLKIDSKTFMVSGGDLTDDLKAKLTAIIPTLNMEGFKLRTKTMSQDAFSQFFEASIMNKEIYLPMKAFNKNVESLIKNQEPVAYDIACWVAGKVFKNTDTAAWNGFKGGRKLFATNDIYQLLGEDLNTRVGFFIINTSCGSVNFTRDTNYDELSYQTSMLIRYSKLLDIKVYNLSSEDSMKELSLLLNL